MAKENDPLWIADKMIGEENAKSIKAGILIVAGGRDDYNSVEGFVFMYRTIPNAQLAIIPNCNHACLKIYKAVMIGVGMPCLNKEVSK